MTRDGYQKITTGENTKKYGFISLLLLFQWMDDIFKAGSTGTIEESDFAPLSRENSTDSYSKRLQTQWEKERAKRKGNGKRPKLRKSVITMISFNEALTIILPRALYALWRLLKPLLLGYLLSSLMEPDPQKSSFVWLCHNYGTRCLDWNNFHATLFLLLRCTWYRSEQCPESSYLPKGKQFFFINLIFPAYGARCIGDNKRTQELFTQRGMIDYLNFV